jgi:hypothetical protein
MKDDDILLLFFALMLSAMVMILWNSFLRRQASRQKVIDYEFICVVCLSKISFEWKFLEQIVDDVFLKPDEELQVALNRCLGEGIQHRTNQILFIEQLVSVFVELKLLFAEITHYSEYVILENPHLFKTLPDRKRDACNLILTETKDPDQEADLQLVRVKKIPQGTPRDTKPKEKKNRLLLAPSY